MRQVVLLCSLVALAVGQFAKDALVEHNKYRRMHGAAPLTLAADLTAYAQKWVNHLANAGNLVHSSCVLNGQPIGENLAARSGTGTNLDISGADATKWWYNEVKNHDFTNNNPNSKTAHFTQVVWKATKQMGIAKTSKNGKVYVAANYRPAGNTKGLFIANVGRQV